MGILGVAFAVALGIIGADQFKKFQSKDETEA